MLLEGIGDLATSWRIKGSSSIIFPQAKSLDYHFSILYPMCLLAVTCIYITYTLKVACPLHVLVVYLSCVCICCAFYLLILRNLVCVSWFWTPCTCEFVLSLLLHLVYLIWLFERLMDYPILGEWCASCTSQSSKCVYMRNTT